MHPAARTTVVVLCLWAAHAAPAASQTVLAKAPSEIVTPARVGQFVRGERLDFNDPQFGVGVQYAPAQKADSSFATVYVYRPTPRSGRWVASEVIDAMAREFRETPEYHRSRGNYEGYRITGERRDTIRAGSHVLPGYGMSYVYWNDGLEVASFGYVYVAGRTLIKVRGTVPASQLRSTRLLEFTRAVVARTVLEN